MLSLDLIINSVLIHIVLSFLGRAISLYMHEIFSNNAIIEVLSMNQRKLVSTSVLVVITVGLAQYLISKNIKIKGL